MRAAGRWPHSGPSWPSLTPQPREEREARAQEDMVALTVIRVRLPPDSKLLSRQSSLVPPSISLPLTDHDMDSEHFKINLQFPL